MLRVLETLYLECEWVSMAREPHNCGSWRARQVCKAVTFQVETLQAFNSARRLRLVIHSFINNFLPKSLPVNRTVLWKALLNISCVCTLKWPKKNKTDCYNVFERSGNCNSQYWLCLPPNKILVLRNDARNVIIQPSVFGIVHTCSDFQNIVHSNWIRHNLTVVI